MFKSQSIFSLVIIASLFANSNAFARDKGEYLEAEIPAEVASTVFDTLSVKLEKFNAESKLKGTALAVLEDDGVTLTLTWPLTSADPVEAVGSELPSEGSLVCQKDASSKSGATTCKVKETNCLRDNFNNVNDRIGVLNGVSTVVFAALAQVGDKSADNSTVSYKNVMCQKYGKNINQCLFDQAILRDIAESALK